MQKSQRTSRLAIRADVIYPPEPDSPWKIKGVVPSSLAAWLAQATCEITTSPEPEQGTFWGLLNQCSIQNHSRKPVKPGRRKSPSAK